MPLGTGLPSIIGIAIGVILLGSGIYQIVKGKYPGDGDQYAEYIPETVAKAARVTGIIFGLMGITILVKEMQDRGYFSLVSSPWIYYALIALLLVCAAIAAGTIMKKK